MSKYSYLYDTPYLYSSRHLRDLYQKTNSTTDLEAIQSHMIRHEVYNQGMYKGYYWLSRELAADLGEDQHLLKWRDMFTEYDLYVNPVGEMKIQRKEF